jgi:hypothetical protein
LEVAIQYPLIGPFGLGVTGLLAPDRGLVPTALVAETWKVYAVPLVRPPTVQLVAGAVAVQPALDGVEVTVYVRIGEPPFEPGVHDTEAEALPPEAVTPVGALGATPCGVTAVDGGEAELVPAALVAVTVKV